MNPFDTPFTLITIGFADQVLRLRCQNKTVEEVVRALGKSELDVLAAHRLFDIPIKRDVLGPARTIVEKRVGAYEDAHAKAPSHPFVKYEAERGDQRSRPADAVPQPKRQKRRVR